MEYAQREKDTKKVKCTKCNVIISSITNFKTHLATKKHINMGKPKEIVIVEKKEVIYQCQHCKKILKYHASLWKHNKKCKVMIKNIVDKYVENTSNDGETIGEMFKVVTKLATDMEIVKHNQMTIYNTTIINNNTNNITNNNNFNLQVQLFLDTNCKHADNIDDMIEKFLKPSISDLTTLANSDIVAVLSNICSNSLTSYETLKRPMHYFTNKDDPQTLQLRIKNESNAWASETDSNDIMKQLLNCIEFRLTGKFNTIWMKDPKNLELMNITAYNKKKNARNRDELDQGLMTNIAKIITVDDETVRNRAIKSA